MFRNLFLLALCSFLFGVGCQLAPPEENSLADDSEPQGVHGYLLMDGTGDPIRGVRVSLSMGSPDRLETVTDRRGHYEFPFRDFEAGGWRVEIHPTDTLKVESTIEEVEWPSERIYFTALALDPGPFRGCIYRAEQGPKVKVPYAMIEVSEPEGTSEICIADSKGYFVTEAKFLGPEIHVAILDHEAVDPGNRSTSFLLRWTPVETDRYVSIGLRVGKRFELEIEGDPDLDWKLWRGELHEAGMAVTNQLGQPSLFVWPGEQPWLRTRGTWKPSPSPRELVLRAKDGRRAYRGIVPAGEVGDGPILMKAVPCGILTGKLGLPVSDPWAEERLRQGLKFRFQREVEPGSEELGFDFEVPIGPRFRVPCLEPGKWKVSLMNRYFPFMEKEVSISAGAVTSVEWTLGAPELLGTLRVRIVDDEGDIPLLGEVATPYYSVDLSLEGEITRSLSTDLGCMEPAEWLFKRVQVEGRWVLEGRVPNAPPGRYGVKPFSTDRILKSEKESMEPGELVIVHAQAHRLEGAWGVRVLGEGFERASGYLLSRVGGAQSCPLSPLPVEDGVHAYEVDSNVEFEWCIQPRRGHQRIYGDRSDFRSKNGGHWLEVVFIPGFAVRLQLVDEAGQPLSESTLSFAGDEFVTDCDGRV